MERVNFENSATFWKEHHSFQEKSGWCGPAIIQMIFKATGIEKTQAEIAKDVVQDWWGTDQRILLAYLSKHYTSLNYKENASVDDIKEHLDKGHIVILDWWDDLDDDEPDGHYSLAAEIKGGIITLADPSGSRNGIWTMKIEDFKSKWRDSIDVRNQIWVEGFMIWIDPKSAID